MRTDRQPPEETAYWAEIDRMLARTRAEDLRAALGRLFRRGRANAPAR